jgi:hypothetical protein
MKKLKGMKNTISSFENNRLNDLRSIGGGLLAAETEKSRTETQPADPNCGDCDVLMDSGRTRTITIC